MGRWSGLCWILLMVGRKASGFWASVRRMEPFTWMTTQFLQESFEAHPASRHFRLPVSQRRSCPSRTKILEANRQTCPPVGYPFSRWLTPPFSVGEKKDTTKEAPWKVENLFFSNILRQKAKGSRLWGFKGKPKKASMARFCSRRRVRAWRRLGGEKPCGRRSRRGPQNVCPKKWQVEMAVAQDQWDPILG